MNEYSGIFRISNRWVSGYDWVTEKPYRHTPIHCGRSGGRPSEHTPVPLTATYHKWYVTDTKYAGLAGYPGRGA